MKKFKVVGFPISQSKSPALFKYIFKSLEIKAEYSAKEIKNSSDLKKFINKCRQSKYIEGSNITMPYKEKISSLIDCYDNIAKLTNSINCIKINDNKILGYNNDYYGFKKLIAINNINLKNTNNIVLGSGGSARTIILNLINNNAKNISILSRNKKTTSKIIEDFKQLNEKTSINIFNNKISYENYNLINCTPIGLKKDTEKNILSQIALINFDTIIDINYLYKNDFLNLCYKKIITGEDMFIFQAFKSLDIWFESKISNKLDYKKIKELIC